MSTTREKAIAVFSDASYCARSGAGAGAYWIQSGDIRLSAGQKLRGASQPHDAEVLAACNGINAVARHPSLLSKLRQGEKAKVLLFVDCVTVIQVFKEDCAIRLAPAVQKVLDEVRKMIARLGFDLQIFHVKAHAGLDTPRKRHNQWCDLRAKQAMRAIRGIVAKAAKEKTAAAPAPALALA